MSEWIRRRDGKSVKYRDRGETVLYYYVGPTKTGRPSAIYSHDTTNNDCDGRIHRVGE